MICKPEGQGSSLGVAIARGPEEISRSLATVAQFDSSVLVEPLVEGREFTISLLGREPLPMIEIVAPRKLFTYEAKYSDPATEYRLNGNLPGWIEAELYRTAIAAADAIRNRWLGASRFDARSKRLPLGFRSQHDSRNDPSAACRHAQRVLPELKCRHWSTG